MKKIVLKFYTPLISLFIITTCCNFNCSKNDDTTNPPDNVNQLPDVNTPYVAYTVLPDHFGNNNNTHYMVITKTFDPITISTFGDTTRLDFSFINFSLTNDANHTNNWKLCNAEYDEKGHDLFQAFSEWTKGLQGKLEENKKYNLSFFDDDGGFFSFEESKGVSQFYHYNAANTLIANYDSYYGSEVFISESYIKIDKIANGTASGSFKIGFHNGCTETGTSGVPTGDNVSGIFNKVPVQ